jgi:bacillopeptidase F
MRKILSIAATLCLLTTGMAVGGYVTPELDTWLSKVADDQYVSTVVMLTDQVDIAALNSELNEMQATRAYRHEVVVRALMEKAQETQGDVIALLEQGVAEGRVKDYKSLWIANVLKVEAKRDFIEELAARADVSDMYLDFEIENIDPVAKREASEQTIASIEEGLERINAPLSWARGYTGAGRLVSNLDTGVDGNHAALASRWRGLTEPYQECWYDPVTGTTFPFDSWGHGTHTMGTTCGYQVNTDDHIGVAYDAKWIAAGVIDRVDIPTTISDAIDAFQWTSDPDGNPGTLDDVPDVSSNSWGISPIYHSDYLDGACDQMFWSVLDACEAAGVVVVFAAGNEGNAAPYSVRNPANRAVDPYNSFCVGAIDGANYGSDPIAYFSSWGPVPTDCGSQTIKPEVAAPGVDVRSSYPGGSYMTMSGTSMACPHVAGAVAVLRQADPNATTEEVKYALMSTAQDLGTAGEDNGYGYGLIDLNAALDVLGASGCWWEMDCELENPPIIIPETGGSFSWGGSLTNHCDSTRYTDIWTMARLPGGYLYGPVLGPIMNVPFGPDRTRSASGITHYVPGGAPQGSYKYKVYYGDYPSAPKDSCVFNVYKQGGGGGGPYNALILLSDDSGAESVAQEAILNDPEGRFLSCDFMSVYDTTPTVDQLLPYDVVQVWSNYVFADAGALGDVLAEYVNVGGAVVLSEFSFYNGWAMGGGLMSDYSPLGVGSNCYSPVSLGVYDPSSPIMAGVTTLSDGAYSTDPPLQNGALVVAEWDNGTPCVAVSGVTPRVVGLNMYFGTQYQQLGGDYALLLPNALAYAGDNSYMRTMGWDTNEFSVEKGPGKAIAEKHSVAPVTSITAVENGMRGEEKR